MTQASVEERLAAIEVTQKNIVDRLDRMGSDVSWIKKVVYAGGGALTGIMGSSHPWLQSLLSSV